MVYTCPQCAGRANGAPHLEENGGVAAAGEAQLLHVVPVVPLLVQLVLPLAVGQQRLGQTGAGGSCQFTGPHILRHFHFQAGKCHPTKKSPDHQFNARAPGVQYEWCGLTQEKRQRDIVRSEQQIQKLVQTDKWGQRFARNPPSVVQLFTHAILA